MPSSINALPTPYLIFVGDETDPGLAKTAFGLRDWAPEKCIAELSCTDNAITTGLPRMTPAEAAQAGAKSLLIGVANQGGFIPEIWLPPLLEALDAGLDIVSGLHTRLSSIPELSAKARARGRNLIDIRTPPSDLPVGTGRKRSGKRLLTVGTDCALGKKYTALSLAVAMRKRGVDADFRATGQTGIMIAGSGIPMDAVVSDFSAGAAEILSPDAPVDHWDIIEGQGSLFHPGYAGVSLGLLHGSQPDIIIMCHEHGRTAMLGTAGYEIPDLRDAIDLTLQLGRRTNPSIRCAGLSFNTSGMAEQAALAFLEKQSVYFGMPVADPVRGGTQFMRLVEACIA